MLKNLLAASIAACLLTGCAMFQKPLQVAVNGKPNAEIVVPGDAHDAVKLAGTELQTWIKAISGAELPIVMEPTKTAKAIKLAVNPKCQAFADDLKAIGSSDGYAVRPCPCGGIVILATRPKGVLNGVFKMLFRNTDIIWARPHPDFGTHFTEDPNLTLKDIDYRDVPVYVLRGWQTGDRNESLLWQVRNGMNWTAETTSYSKDTVKYDPVREFGGGHNLCGLYIREKKYYDKHPEFYPLIKGERVRHSKSHGGCQLCFSNKEMTRCFVEEVDNYFKACPYYDTYRIMIEDNYNLCECDECLKPIKLEDGTVVTKDDEAFRSTQFFLWLNPIARHIKEKYHKEVLSFAYFFTEIPPKCKVEDNIHLSLCPIYKNSKYDILAPENESSFKKLDGWLKITPNVTWREYYGLCWAFPRPIDVIAARDWRYANSRGVTQTYSEMRPDYKVQSGTESWDVNAMYFWVMTQSAWNPYLDVKELRRTFLKRVYGPAARDVEKFYAIIEDSWFELPGNSTWNDRARGNWVMYVVKAGKTDACKAALDAAAKKQLTPKGALMLKRLRAIFEASTIGIQLDTMSSTRVQNAPDFDPRFNSGDWTKAEKSSNFRTHAGITLNPPTDVRILHDDKAFYVGFHCVNKDFSKLKAQPAGIARDTWCTGEERVETFFTGINSRGKVDSFQFVITSNGNIYDACGLNAEWNGDISTKIDKQSDGWSIMLTIPFKTLGYKEFPKNVKCSFMRYYTAPSGATEVGYWNDMSPNSIANYTDLTLK